MRKRNITLLFAGIISFVILAAYAIAAIATKRTEPVIQRSVNKADFLQIVSELDILYPSIDILPDQSSNSGGVMHDDYIGLMCKEETLLYYKISYPDGEYSVDIEGTFPEKSKPKLPDRMDPERYIIIGGSTVYVYKNTEDNSVQLYFGLGKHELYCVTISSEEPDVLGAGYSEAWVYGLGIAENMLG